MPQLWCACWLLKCNCSTGFISVYSHKYNLGYKKCENSTALYAGGVNLIHRNELFKWLDFFFWEIEEKISTFSWYAPNRFLAEFLYQPISFEEVGFPNIFPPNSWINAMGRNSASKCYQIMRITWLESSVLENPELVTCTKAYKYTYIYVC